MMFLGTTVLALSVLTGAPDSAPAAPQTKVEAPPKKQPKGTLVFAIKLSTGPARLRVQGDAEKKVPFRVELPIGTFVSFQITHIKAS